MEVVKMRAGQLLRRGWKATVFLAVFAALAGGVAMAAWSLGRKSSTVFERFIAYSDPSDTELYVCPPGFQSPDEQEIIQQCFTPDLTDAAATARAADGIAEAGWVALSGATASRVGTPDRVEPTAAVLRYDSEPEWPGGRPLMVAGRSPDPAATDEITINEQFASALGASVGDELDLDFWSVEEFGLPGPPGQQRYTGPHLRARIVGIERTVEDLIASAGVRDQSLEQSRITLGPAVATTLGDDIGRFGAVYVAFEDEAVGTAAIEEQFSGQFHFFDPILVPDVTDPVIEAIRYESRGAMLFGAITALAAAVFVGQAVARQSRREWTDGPTLRTLGMSTRDAASAAVVRGAVTGLLAVALATVAAVALSVVGPFGLSAQAETDHGPIVDWLVLGVGAIVVMAVVAVGTTWPVVRQFRRAATPVTITRRHALRSLQANLPPSGTAGLSMTVSGRGAGGLPTGTALAGLGLAFLTAVGAVVLWSSFDEMLSTPARFGAPWDVSVSYPLNSPGQVDRVAEHLANDPRIESAALMFTADVKIGEQLAPIMAYAPVEGIEAVLPPVITSGRQPETVDEIALGSVTMDELSLSLGDQVSVDSSGTGPLPPDISSMTIVGTTVYNDTYENSPGRGGLVVPEWMVQEELTSIPTPYVVTLVPATDVQQFKDDVLPVASRSLVLDPTLQGAIRNVQRVRVVPYLLAALVFVLAIASLAHALVLSVRRQRRQLAVFKSLGFRRGQVRAAVAWHTTALVIVPTVVGVPLGIVVGRWVWRIVTDGLGLASPPSTPALWIVVIVLAILAAANLMAAVPAWMAARVRTAEALRSE